MKKLIFILLILSTVASAEVTLQDCLDDASLHADNRTPQQPLSECADIINSDSGKITVTSADSRWKAFGIGHMLYLDSFDAQGILIDRVLLSGSSTELVSIKKLFIDTVYKKLFVIQQKNDQYELMVHNLLFIGNVSPQKVMRSPTFNGVTAIKMNSASVIEVVNASGTFLVKADGESRQELSSKKALEITAK